MHPTTEHSRRVRAARNYAGYSQKDFPEVVAISYGRLRRIEQLKAAPTWEEMWQVADACNVPRAFFEDGFVSEVAHDERLDVLLHLVREHDLYVREASAARASTRPDLIFSRVLAAIEENSEKLDRLEAFVASLQGDMERAVRDASRSITQSAVDLAERASPAGQAASNTRDAEDAKQVKPPARGARKP